MKPEIPSENVYAMVLARDALIVQLFLQLGAPVMAASWDAATAEIDQAIMEGLVDWDLIGKMAEREDPLPGFENIVDVEGDE